MPNQRVYVANADDQSLSVLELGADGSLGAIATVPVQQPVQTGRSMVLALSPDRRTLYAAFLGGSGSFDVASYAIDVAGAVPVLRGRAPLTDTVAYMTTDRTGRFLVCASYGGNKLFSHLIAADGTVGEAVQVVADLPKAHCVLLDRGNRYALHTSLGADLIHQQAFDATTGHLTPLEPSRVAAVPGSGPRFLAFGRDARHVYVIGELDGSVTVYPFDPLSGRLAPAVQRVSILPLGFAGPVWAADLRITPDGAWLYTSERTSSTLAIFAIHPPTGLLRRVGVEPTLERPRAMAIDAAGRYLLVAGQLTGCIRCYAIDPASGRLNPLGDAAVGRNPTWVEIRLDGASP